MGNESSHSVVIGRATAHGKGANPGRGAAAQIAHMLGKLRRQRNEADYDVGDDFIDAQQCEAVLLRAAEVLRLCQEVAQKISAAKA